MSYAVFAPFYDAVMGDRAGEADYLRSLIERYHPAARTLLELACGTGAVLEQLQPSYEVAGVDLSRAMLDLARTKVPSARLVQGDITSIELADRFDAVLCVFDSINHLLDFAQWEAVFDRAREHLTPRGLFLFDMNTEAKLERFSALRPGLTGSATAISSSPTCGLPRWRVRVEPARLRAPRWLQVPLARGGHPRGRVPERTGRRT